MPTAIVTGSGGLIGSASVRRFAADGYRVLGLDNDARASFFGPEASTAAVSDHLAATVERFEHHPVDIRDRESVSALFERNAADLRLIVHAAAQPSHDWAARDPHADFSINATGTLNLLEAARSHCPEATFAFLSTNKVYGDTPNRLPLEEHETRLELPTDHRWFEGIDTEMSIDRSTHSLFGASKAAADLLVQEYGRYFGMPTACFRCGCLTGPDHAGAKLHGFLAYLMKCAVNRDPYTVIGYGGKQVRDNLHADDVASAVAAFHSDPRPAAVYNLGGGRENSCSVLEAIEICERVSGARMEWSLEPKPRAGDHRWWISDLAEFRKDYPGWQIENDLETIVTEIGERIERSAGSPA